MLDPNEVYLCTEFAGDRVIGGPEVVTDVNLFVPEGHQEGSQQVSFWGFRSAGPHRAGYPVVHVAALQDGSVEVYRADLTRQLRVPVKRRYEALTLENFARIAESVEGYDKVIAQARTDAQLRAWYREAILD